MRKLYILFLLAFFSSCMFETRNDLNVTIINKSKNKVYLGEAFYGCDSCGIMKDVRLFCVHGNDTTYFPRILNAGDSTIMRTKLHDIQKLDVINVDSLIEYCEKGLNYNIMNKPWAKILTNKVDLKTKTCKVLIE